MKRAPDANEFRAVLELLGLFSRDPDLRVRVELVEQIPNIAIVCFHEGKLDDPVGMYLLPLLITTLTDTIPQVSFAYPMFFNTIVIKFVLHHPGQKDGSGCVVGSS